jgi:hypothetical protein
MKKLLLIALMSSAVSGAFARKVKFSVDMKNETVSANGVHVAGNFQSWSPSTTALTQEGSTTIYSVIADVTDASLVEFKFINGNDWPQSESVPNFSRKSTNTNGGDGSDNRWFFAGSGSDTLMLPAFLFAGTAPDGQYAVRFIVDLAKEDSVSSNGVSMAGLMQDWKPELGTMSNLYSSNKLYERIYTMANGTFGFKYVNGNAWGKDESVPSACATENNRTVTVNGADIALSKVCYGSCDACPSRPIPQYKITFRVDMSTTCNFDSVEIASGKINGWNGGSYLVKGANNVWSYEFMSDSGSEVAHKFRKIKNGISDWEGGADKKVTAHSDTILAARCFGQEVPCGPSVPPSDVTFRVNMGDEIVASKVYVIGTMTSPQWQAGAIELTESTSEADVYETTVSGICPDVIEYKFYNGDVNSEANSEKFLDSTNRGCVGPNGLGAFNRKLTRTSADAITVYWVYGTCRLGETAGISSLNNEVKISPNPAVGKFNITLAGSKVNEVSIVSIDGRVVRNFKTNEVSYDVNVSGLTGVYFVNITDSLGRTAVKKIVLQ